MHYSGSIAGLRFVVYSFSFFTLITTSVINAQTDRKLTRDGNKMYADKKYAEAEENYKKALSKNPKAQGGLYNLGDAMYKENKFDTAAAAFQNFIKDKKDPDVLSKAWHNLGNTYLQQKKYDESINSYKNSLRYNPKDTDTKYNLAYAQSMLKQQQQQQQQDKDNKDKKDNKDQKDQNKNQDKDKKDQNKDNQQNKDQENKDQQDKDKQAQSQKKQGISKEDAERMLQALNNDEKNLQKKLVKKGQPVKVKIEKDW